MANFESRESIGSGSAGKKINRENKTEKELSDERLAAAKKKTKGNGNGSDEKVDLTEEVHKLGPDSFEDGDDEEE